MTMYGKFSAWVAAVVTAWALFGAVPGLTATLPHFAEDSHLGVTSCAGSTCHGAVEPWKDSTVLQNEYITWQRQDKHAKAYQVLLNERSQRIAKNLGLPNAHTAEICLDCHADNPAANKRGRQFQVSDGVGCEACHGGAQRWLGIHIAGSGSHQDNVTAGMYPTENAVDRAKLCVSCHFGDTRKFVTHRIMGAGHPRMSFELNTFTAIQPAHYRVDLDYPKRKRVFTGMQTWAIGQSIALSETLDALMDAKRGRDGIFPELVLFDCHSCHHPMSNLRWEARASTGLGPGVVKFNDANVIMLRIIADRVDPEQGKAVRALGVALHTASTQGHDAMLKVAKDLREVSGKLTDKFAAHVFGKDDMTALLTGVVKEGLSGEYIDYSAAEQATMALGSIITAMRAGGIIDEKQQTSLSAAVDKCYAAVAKDEEYQPRTFIAALQLVQAAIPSF